MYVLDVWKAKNNSIYTFEVVIAHAELASVFIVADKVLLCGC